MFAALYLNVSTIIVIDIVPSRLELAKSFGVHHVVNGKDKDVVEQIQALTGGLGVKYAVEASGVVPVLATAYKSLANFGHLVR